MEDVHAQDLYQETLSNLQDVLDGRQRMFEVYFFRPKENGLTEKIRCQSVFCPADEEEAFQVLTERAELVALANEIDSAEIIVDEMSEQRVQKMHDKLAAELAEPVEYHSLFFRGEIL